MVHPSVAQRKDISEQLQGAPLNLGLAQYLCTLFPAASCKEIAAWWACARWNPQLTCAGENRNPSDSEELGYKDFIQSSKLAPPCMPRRWSPLDSARPSSRPLSARSHPSRPGSARSQRRP